jgi:hypothetical protein
MTRRAWLWVGAILDLLLLVPGFYMAISAADLAMKSEAGLAVAVAALFCALPVFCIMAPFAAWRAAAWARPAFQIATLFATPWIYAVFLVAFLFYG